MRQAQVQQIINKDLELAKELIENYGIRAERDRLDNVSVITGRPANPALPANSFDRIFLVRYVP